MHEASVPCDAVLQETVRCGHSESNQPIKISCHSDYPCPRLENDGRQLSSSRPGLLSDQDCTGRVSARFRDPAYGATNAVKKAVTLAVTTEIDVLVAAL